MTCAEHQKLEADAILLERAKAVLDRRFSAETLMDPAWHATREVLRIAAAHMRRDAREPVPEHSLERGQRPGQQRQARVPADLGAEDRRQDPAVREPGPAWRKLGSADH